MTLFLILQHFLPVCPTVTQIDVFYEVGGAAINVCTEVSFGTLGMRINLIRASSIHLWPISRLEFGGSTWQWIVSRISIERNTIYSYYYYYYTFNTSVNMTLLLNTLETLKVRLTKCTCQCSSTLSLSECLVFKFYCGPNPLLQFHQEAASDLQHLHLNLFWPLIPD